jgi:hypothetical protein
MHAGFPTPPEPTLGALHLFILTNLLQYICKCTQTHKSTISKEMNLFYVKLDPSLYTHYSAGKAYPHAEYRFLDNIDEVPYFIACTNNNAAKITHAILIKTRSNVINMNAMLNKTLISLIPTTFKLIYE